LGLLLSAFSKERDRFARFTIGIPVSSGDDHVLETLNFVLNEPRSSEHILNKVVVVASGIDEKMLEQLTTFARSNEKVKLIFEDKRYGKWEAINRLIDNSEGEYLVLLNGDALPLHGAIDRLLEKITSDDRIAVVSAFPLAYSGTSLTGSVVEIFWDAHNEALTRLNQYGGNNHSCDELMVVRLDKISKLPPGTINDGAYIAGSAYLAGYRISFCRNAFVKVRVPKKLGDLLRQRRRIIFGHMQIWNALGRAPRTMESLSVQDPKLALTILVAIMSRKPRHILVLPVALVEEAFAMFLAWIDKLTRSKRHLVWDRYVR
jgi:cellulose synthase/poly-beta-1,6-N-acetylglucosamine synthase-like glycosyltransferase